MRSVWVASACWLGAVVAGGCSGGAGGEGRAASSGAIAPSPASVDDAGMVIDRSRKTSDGGSDGSSAAASGGSFAAASSGSAGASSAGAGASSVANPATGGSSSSVASTARGSSSSSGASAVLAGVDAGGEAGTHGGTSSGGPMLGGCPLFPANSPWNTRIDDPASYPVHANSAAYIASIGVATHLHPDWGNWSTDHYGIPWQTVAGTQTTVPMVFGYADQSDPGPYPFPANARIEGGAGSGGDMHVLVLDTGTCTLYETWSSTYKGPGWSCGSGAKFDTTSNALRPAGWTSADAAGLPVLPGLVRLAEVQAGAIRHALRFTVQSSQQGYIHPATHAAGKSDPALAPMGLRVRLKASVNLSSFTGPALVILTAMKQYGMIVADNGSNWYVSGDSDDGWTSSLMDGVTSAFGALRGSDFEAIETGPILTDGL